MERPAPARPRGPLFQLVKLHAKGGGDNGKITEHAAAHQRNTAKKRDVGKPFFAAGEFAAEPGQQQACGNGDRRTVNFTAKDVGRDPLRLQQTMPTTTKAVIRALLVKLLVRIFVSCSILYALHRLVC